MKIIALVLFISTLSLTRASSCGESAIPFSFEALANGQPVLGCARPTCFGWTADSEPVSSNAQFHRINGVPDGFMRKSSEATLKRYGDHRYNFQQERAYCDTSFGKTSCGFEGQWVGGIGPVLNITTQQQLSLQCCSYEGLRQSTNRGVAVVKPGQTVIGGEVTKKGRQYAFDYISDIALRRGPDESISYDVSVRRFPCVPIPNEQTASADSDVHSEIIKKLDSSVPAGNTIAFQAPIHQFGEGQMQPMGVDVEAPARPQEGTYRRVEGVQQYHQRHPHQYYYQTQPAQQAAYQPQPQPQQYYYQPQHVQQVAYQPQPQPQQYYYQPQPAQPQYYQRGGFGGLGGLGSFWCFSADTLVHTSQGKDVRMDELKLGDFVLTKQAAKLSYLPVKSWLHRLPKQKANFQKIELEDGTTLKLTSLHYIYTTTCDKVGERVDMESVNNKGIRAEEVKEGECVYQVKGEQNSEYLVKTRVISNTVVNGTGIYAPSTATDDIVVNKIHASCHAVLHSSMQSTFFGYADYIRNLGRWLFGSDDNEVKDVPMGTESWASMVELVLPKDLHTF